MKRVAAAQCERILIGQLGAKTEVETGDRE
jgi:hypothetical protein